MWKALGEIAARVRSPLTFLVFALGFDLGVLAFAANADTPSVVATALLWFGIPLGTAVVVMFFWLTVWQPEKLYGLRDWANDENFMNAMKPQLRSAIRESPRPDLSLIRASIELYAVQNGGEYPNFATGWDDLIDNDYLVEPPANPMSPHDVATDVLTFPRCRWWQRRRITGSDVDPEDFGWGWDDAKHLLWLSGSNR